MLKPLLESKKTGSRMPALFFGHGSPMNSIEENSYTRALQELGKKLPRPRAILVISAHWLTRGSTLVAEASQPRTIHDFGGFPKELHEVQYPALGSPETAGFVRELVRQPQVLGDSGAWGLDHGTWSVLRHLYPLADVPVLQLSIDMSQPPEHHFRIGEQLAALRERGVLVVGSGNIVHNLRVLRWEKDAPAFDWAVEFDEWVKKRLVEGDSSSLMRDFHQSEAGRLSVPTMDHYLPLFYVLGAAEKKDQLCFEFEGIQNGSASMRSFSLSF